MYSEAPDKSRDCPNVTTGIESPLTCTNIRRKKKDTNLIVPDIVAIARNIVVQDVVSEGGLVG